MKRIKFCGIDIETKEKICSDSIKFDEQSNGEKICWLRDELYNWVVVAPESIEQFIGYDSENNEVYEGDKLLNAKEEVGTMTTEIEKKIMQLGYLHEAWREIWDYDAAALDDAQRAIDDAIISISQELVELYEAEKEKRGVDMLSE